MHIGNRIKKLENKLTLTPDKVEEKYSLWAEKISQEKYLYIMNEAIRYAGYDFPDVKSLSYWDFLDWFIAFSKQYIAGNPNPDLMGLYLLACFLYDELDQAPIEKHKSASIKKEITDQYLQDLLQFSPELASYLGLNLLVTKGKDL